ncbi:hypothetical protein E2562_004112 [Oryza meyeriana var. granulata]|uniref:Uncharacterized protein n=1 Tax=Oryza meyeriana var. granulata TaxID=110450 RepID=A0A6G1EUZ2_9ORYZ|nr:hypothetical protein E2562_004112 [Oryza meyeriana var. granulata]
MARRGKGESKRGRAPAGQTAAKDANARATATASDNPECGGSAAGLAMRQRRRGLAVVLLGAMG